jgi:hypothetical protein
MYYHIFYLVCITLVSNFFYDEKSCKKLKLSNQELINKIMSANISKRDKSRFTRFTFSINLIS